MASFTTPANGDDALAEHVAQITEDFSGLRNIPIGLTGINDAAAYAQTIKNAGTGSKGLIVYAADGTTVLLQVDGSGVLASASGGAAAAILTSDSTITPPATDPPAANQLTRRSIAKGWVKCDNGGNISASYNVTSITDAGVGELVVTWATDFASANYAIVVTCQGTNARIPTIEFSVPPTAGGLRIQVYDTAGAAADPSAYHVAAFGDQ